MSDDKDDKKEAFSPERITFENRYVTVVGEINDKLAKATSERLLALAAVSDDPITMFVSSPGGHVESGDMVHDLMKFIKPEVRVIGSGLGGQRGRVDIHWRGKRKPFLPAQYPFLAASTQRRRGWQSLGR